MSTTLWAPPATFTSFANASSTSPSGSCGPCTSIQIYDLWRGSWAQQNSSLPALRTLQPIINPNDNTTSTSTSCNSAALPAYSDNGSCQSVYLSDECELVCVDSGGRVGGSGQEPYTITMSGTSGNYLQWANDFRIQGAVSTTDSNGASSCAISHLTASSVSIFTYTGPTIQTSLTGWLGGSRIMMPDLTSYYPNEGIYAQCSYFQTGPPPIALTAVNEIVLPVLTLPRSTTEDSPETTTSPSTTSPTTTAQPGPSEFSRIPSQTSVSRTTDATTSSEQSEGPASTNTPPASNGSPTTTASPDGTPPVIATPSENGGEDQEPSSNSPGSPGQGATTNRQSANDGSPTTTASSVGAPPVVAPPSDNSEEQAASSNVPVIPAQGATTNTLPANSASSNPAASSNSAPPIIALPSQTSDSDQTSPEVIVVGGSTTISAGGQAAAASGTTFSVLPSAGGVIGIADGETTILALPTPAPAPAPVSDFVRPVTSAQQEGFVVAGPTITQGGEGVVISGTTYTVLPSGSGVVAISDAGSTTLQPSQLPGLGINTVPDSEGEYAFPSQTLSPSGSAVVVAGATYSALPQGSGIFIAASGSSSIIAVPETTSIQGLGEVEILETSSGDEGVYVLDNSVTVSAGGAPATISNTVYSALPSGFGVLVIPGGSGVGDGDNFAAYIEQGVSGTGSSDGKQQGETYIIGAELVSEVSNGAGSVTTVAGVVYSALPSGSGVLVVANGTSTTVSVSDGTSRSTSTNGSGEDGPDESVVAFAGTASPGRYGMRAIGWAGYMGVLVVVGMCLVR